MASYRANIKRICSGRSIGEAQAKLAKGEAELGLQVGDPSQLNLEVRAELAYRFHQVSQFCGRHPRFPRAPFSPSHDRPPFIAVAGIQGIEIVAQSTTSMASVPLGLKSPSLSKFRVPTKFVSVTPATVKSFNDSAVE